MYDCDDMIFLNDSNICMYYDHRMYSEHTEPTMPIHTMMGSYCDHDLFIIAITMLQAYTLNGRTTRARYGTPRERLLLVVRTNQNANKQTGAQLDDSTLIPHESFALLLALAASV